MVLRDASASKNDQKLILRRASVVLDVVCSLRESSSPTTIFPSVKIATRSVLTNPDAVKCHLESLNIGLRVAAS